MRRLGSITAGAFVLVAAVSWVSAGSPVVIGDTLDAVAVRREYQDGNFESLTRTLESYRQGKIRRRQDSLVLAKYLGVMYAANHATIEKGKYWLHKMLEINPRADIVDLYVSEDIHAALDRVRKELATRTAIAANPIATPATPPPVSAPPAPAVRAPSVGEPPVKGWTWDLNLGFGRKNLNSTWGPLADQGAFRLGFDFKPVQWRLNMTVDLITTTATDKDTAGSEIKGGTSEFHLGVRKLWEKPGRSWRPFAGSGLGFVLAERDTGSSGSVQRASPGVWMQAGIYWRLWRKWNLGLSSNYTIAGVHFRGQKTNPGSFTGVILLGYHH